MRFGTGLGLAAGGFVKGYESAEDIKNKRAARDAQELETKTKRDEASRSDAERAVMQGAKIPGIDTVPGNYDPAAAATSAYGDYQSKQAADAAQAASQTPLARLAAIFHPNKVAVTASSAGVGPPLTPADTGAAPAGPPPTAPAPTPGVGLGAAGGVTAPETPAVGLAGAQAAPVPGADQATAPELTVTARGPHKMTEAEGALFRAQALRKIGNTQGSMAAFKEYHDLTMAEQKKAMMFANDDELSTKISDLTGRDVDVQTNKDGAKEVTVDGKKSHTFGSQEALLNFGFGMLDNDPQASLQAVTASNKEATQSLLVRGEMQKITSSIRNAAEELQLRKRSDFRTQTEWEQAQGEYKQMQADADILDDPSNAYTRPDEYAQAASRAGRNRYTSKEINTSTQTVDPTTQMVTRAPANRAIEAGKAEAARIASDPWVVGKVIGTGNGQFGVRGPDGKAYPANSFAHAQRLAKRLYPNGPPVAAKAK